ncbi:MAG: substrate-binding domain-containing protein, partial [Victivallales bacterium]|nr:substrate-binding domain-containing protein [Victivallales bacterium]
GVKVPEEVAVVGGDDIELCRYVQPGLTTFDNRPFDLGKTACQTLLKLIDNKPMKNKNLVLKSKILSRKSL